MIAGQTHKSSINPQGAKDALFSSNRQPSQTEHHHKPDTPSFPLRWGAPAPTARPVLLYGSFSPPFFVCFLILFFSFLNITAKELYKMRTPFTPLFLTRPPPSKREPARTSSAQTLNPPFLIGNYLFACVPCWLFSFMAFLVLNVHI